MVKIKERIDKGIYCEVRPTVCTCNNKEDCPNIKKNNDSSTKSKPAKRKVA